MDQTTIAAGTILRASKTTYKIERPYSSTQHVVYLATKAPDAKPDMKGATLANYLEEKGKMAESRLKKVVLPIAEALKNIPRASLDFNITPDSIVLLKGEEGIRPIVIVCGTQPADASAPKSLKATKQLAMAEEKKPEPQPEPEPLPEPEPQPVVKPAPQSAPEPVPVPRPKPKPTLTAKTAPITPTIIISDRPKKQWKPTPSAPIYGDKKMMDEVNKAPTPKKKGAPIAISSERKPRPNPTPEQSNSVRRSNEDFMQKEPLGLGWKIALWGAILLMVASGAFYFYNQHQQKVRLAHLAQIAEEEANAVPIDEDGYLHGHEYVDLGLSVMWASTNVGASSDDMPGDYFAWGDDIVQSVFSDGGTVAMGLDSQALADQGFTEDGELLASHDPATAQWGEGWRLPTRKEVEELIKKCNWTWEGHGYRVTGPSGNYIYLPAAGLKMGTTPSYRGRRGHYWASTPHDRSEEAYMLYFTDDERKVGAYKRSRGSSIRAVTDGK